MNRAERRKHQSSLRKQMGKIFGVAKNHLHDVHTQAELDKTKEQVREFLKTYNYKGSVYEKELADQLELRELLKQNNVFTGSICLFRNYPVLEMKTKKIIYTDIYLLPLENGWFLKYEKLPFAQNVLSLICEMGFELLMSDKPLLCEVKGYGYAVPSGHIVLRQAFDSLSLKYGDEWVNYEK